VRRAVAGGEGVEIETVRGQGYRLHADVREDQPFSRSGSRTIASAGPRRAPAPNVQRTQFCTATDGTRLAYARLGDGPPLVKVANWLSHLELDRTSPVWRHWLTALSRTHCLIRYDARGNGLSEWHPPTIGMADFISDLGAVFDAAGVERAPVLGLSQGAAVAVAYAARHPDRVSALILIGGCARGWRVKNHPRLTERLDALMVLMRQGWGSEHPAFRQIFTSSFFPHGTPEETNWLNELQRQTTTPENAVALLSALGDVNIVDDMRRVRVPTLVLHSRADAVVPMKDGIELATGIEGARFVALDSDNHVLLGGEPAWSRCEHEIETFLEEAGA
jgi:pimeloyl-ACP methyl ester carboxylesterase